MKGIVERLDDSGRGIVYIDGKINFINKVLPGETIEFEIIKSKKNYNEGRLIKIIESSPKRIKPVCPYFDICGGCDFQNLNYIDSLNCKVDNIIKLFNRINIDIKPIIINNTNPFNYRNKITLKVVNKQIGYYKNNTHDIISIDNCNIVNDSINKTIKLLNNFNIINGEIIIRSNYNNEILIIINSLDKLNIDIDNLNNNINLSGLVINNKTIYGNNFLIQKINDIKYKVSYDSFFQVNPYIASKLFLVVSDNINENDKVLDIYSGVGTLSLSAAKKGALVTGIEIIPNAVDNAKYNANLNNLNNTDFILSDAKEVIKKVGKDFNKVIVDPPRSGLQKEVINTILDINPESIIYVSCDVQTLLRDINILKDKYYINDFYILDMFSYTYHVESVVILEKIK